MNSPLRPTTNHKRSRGGHASGLQGMTTRYRTSVVGDHDVFRFVSIGIEGCSIEWQTERQVEDDADRHLAARDHSDCGNFVGMPGSVNTHLPDG
jgi:hypothetical protein